MAKFFPAQIQPKDRGRIRTERQAQQIREGVQMALNDVQPWHVNAMVNLPKLTIKAYSLVTARRMLGAYFSDPIWQAGRVRDVTRMESVLTRTACNGANVYGCHYLAQHWHGVECDRSCVCGGL